jgi:hypothetical protein
MKAQRQSAWAIEDSRSFQLSIAAVYAPLILMVVAAAVIF